jgi:hypothetical protein
MSSLLVNVYYHSLFSRFSITQTTEQCNIVFEIVSHIFFRVEYAKLSFALRGGENICLRITIVFRFCFTCAATGAATTAAVSTTAAHAVGTTAAAHAAGTTAAAHAAAGA